MKKIMPRLIAIRVILLMLTTPIIAQPIDHNASLSQHTKKATGYASEKKVKSTSFQRNDSRPYHIMPALKNTKSRVTTKNTKFKRIKYL